MGEIEDAALGKHHIVIEVVRQFLPQFHGEIVEADRFGQQIVGTHDGGVAADIAGAEPALFQHRDIGDAVFLGQIVGRRQPVATAADDDDVVIGFRLGPAPGGFPVAIAVPGVLDKGEKGIFGHGACPLAVSATL
jgi:hypothetical protein